MNSSESNEITSEPATPLAMDAALKHEIEAATELAPNTSATPLSESAAEPVFVPDQLPDATGEAVKIDQSPAEKTATTDENVAAQAGATISQTSIVPEKVIAEKVENAPAKKAEISAANTLEVEFSPPPDALHSASLTLQLRCASPNAAIRYALNGEELGENSLLYNSKAKIFLTETTTIKAQAFVDEESGPIASARFEINKPSWQKIEPTDQSDATTHQASDEAVLEGAWHLAAASERGKLHAHRGGWREDAFRHGMARAGDATYSIVVVSDGAGSAPLSRVGSNLLCQTVLDFLGANLAQAAPLSSDSKLLVERDLPWLRGLLVESARLALQKLRDEAKSRARELSDFSSTLLILVRRQWNGQQLCAALQAGDGAIALWNADDTLTLLGEADHGEHSGQTRFINTRGMEDELPARVKFSIRPNLRAVAVMTDGVADDFFPETQQLPELFKIVLPLVEPNDGAGSSKTLLDWIDYEKKGSADDRALVVCWRDSTSVENSTLTNTNSILENKADSTKNEGESRDNLIAELKNDHSTTVEENDLENTIEEINNNPTKNEALDLEKITAESEMDAISTKNQAMNLELNNGS